MIIFAENFRGFREIRIDTDRNMFLVGDNSSGKTSILHLIDYVCRTDLFGSVNLNQEFNVGRSDFFSPYFENADVTIGFEEVVDEKPVIRIITITRIHGANTAYAVRASYASSWGICITNLKEFKPHAKVVMRPNLTFNDALSLHHSAKGKFTAVKGLPDRTLLNEKQVAFLAILQLAPKVASSNQGLIFGVVPACRHLGPMRAKPESFYQVDRRVRPAGDNFATMMQDYAEAPRQALATKHMNKFGKESGLFEKITIRPTSRKVYDSPMMAVVTRNGKDFLINQVGIGVSQVAPILAETQAILHGFFDEPMMLLEQPELHLHPIAQAALGEYIWATACMGIKYVVETHSDFLIDRYRAKIRESKIGSNAKIIYCKSSPEGNTAYEIDIDNEGKLTNPPDGYQEFFLKELVRTIF